MEVVLVTDLDHETVRILQATPENVSEVEPADAIDLRAGDLPTVLQVPASPSRSAASGNA
jgi:hypothetical protein